jgi:hypothetical protein
MTTQQSGYDGTPLKYRTNASKQTEESARYRQSRPRVADEEIDDGWTVEKPHTSAIRYDRPIAQPRKTSGLQRQTRAKKTRVVGYRRFFVGRWLLIIGLLLFVLALGIMAFNAFSTWWQLHTDDVTYGRPRTFQTDQYVGHGDSQAHPNHFIAVNLNGIVEVVEINTQDVKLDHAYFITTTSNVLNPVTLTFPTIDGKQYMYVAIGDSNSAYTVAMVNDGKEFTGAQH